MVRIDPGDLDAHLPQHVLELIDGSTVQGRRRHDVVAGGEEREQRSGLRGEAAGESHRAAAALQARDALLEHRQRRIHDPRVSVAVFLQIEVGGGGGGVLEDVARGLKNRHGPRSGVRIRTLTGVNLAGVKAELA